MRAADISDQVLEDNLLTIIEEQTHKKGCAYTRVLSIELFNAFRITWDNRSEGDIIYKRAKEMLPRLIRRGDVENLARPGREGQWVTPEARRVYNVERARIGDLKTRIREELRRRNIKWEHVGARDVMALHYDELAKLLDLDTGKQT